MYYDLPDANKYVCAKKETQKRWWKLLDGGSMVYVYASTGFGKTTQAKSFAREYYKESVRFTAIDDDFTDRLADWMETHKKSAVKTLLILDDLQWILDPEKRQQFFRLLLMRRAYPKWHIMLFSRAALPRYLSSLWMTQQLVVEDSSGLKLEKEQVRELLIASPAASLLLTENQYSLIDRICQTSRGYALAVVCMVQRLAEYPDSFETAVELTGKDIKNFLDHHLMEQWTYARQLSALRLSVFQSFTKGMARRVLGEDSEQVLHDFIDAGSFLKFEAPDTYTMMPFFREYLCERLKTELDWEWRSLYETAAACYEEKRNIEQALYCYKQANRKDKIAELVVYLSENADGCSFAQTAWQYMEELPADMEKSDPRILSAKAMLCAYRMQPEQCMEYLEQLQQMAQAKEKSILREKARYAYVRTAISCPCNTADDLKKRIPQCIEYVVQGGFPLRNIMPTGNQPSLISGGLDLLSWEKNKKSIYQELKTAVEKFMDVEAVGIVDGFMGEILYEQNQLTGAMTNLTKAMSDVNLNGSIRVEYTLNAIMARLFQAEGENATAIRMLENIRQKAVSKHFDEMLPNMECSLILCALLDNDGETYDRWLSENAIDEHQPFYITSRFQLLVKARVYVAVGRIMEAMYIIQMLEEYAKIYHRPYLQIELLILTAIILYRREEHWQDTLMKAVKQAQPYGLVRVFADQGAALMPLWQKMEWNGEIPDSYLDQISRECKNMEKFYPNYMSPPRRFGSITNKEMEVLRLMAQGRNNSQIAEELGINLGTAKFHVKNIMQKLNASSRTVAVKAAQEQGML